MLRWVRERLGSGSVKRSLTNISERGTAQLEEAVNAAILCNAPHGVHDDHSTITVPNDRPFHSSFFFVMLGLGV